MVLYKIIKNLLNMPQISVIFFEFDIIRFNLFNIEYAQDKTRQGKARQGKASVKNIV